mmetsp:Transcript_18431/g.25925  ORF Transcript_18431/g.25925 Transcript_18431/m.25925 type:complete len:93 (+) Transcript_18431:1454-1732(+)
MKMQKSVKMSRILNSSSLVHRCPQAASVLDPERYIFPKFKDRRTDVSRTRAENLTLWCGHTREPSSWDLTARQHTQCVQFVQRSGASLQIEL